MKIELLCGHTIEVVTRFAPVQLKCALCNCGRTTYFDPPETVRPNNPVAVRTPAPLILFCPNGHRHIDEGEFATKPHHTHACQTCGIVWRPALIDTVGVQFLPGYKNEG